ncbi:MAG: transposase, partial [Candidatus Aminicenantia bacterium]
KNLPHTQLLFYFRTKNKNGRIIYRWEYEEVLEEMKERVKRERDKVKKRNLMTEHIFGTMKRGFNQGYMLMRGKEKTGAEMALTVLAYNIKRVLNIIGLDRLKEAVFIGRVLKNNIIKGTKEIFSCILRFSFEKSNKILSLTKMNLLYPHFSHNLTVCVYLKFRRRRFG